MKTFEVAACSSQWATIDPKTVPSRAMLKYQTAMLNEVKSTRMTAKQEDTGNRYPEDPDRVAARKRLIEHLLSGANIKVSGVDPHEILKAYTSASSTAQKLIAKKQWDSKLKEVFDAFVEMEGLDPTNSESLKTSRMCSLVPMMDVSGSMSGLPMDVSIGLGLFICGLHDMCGVTPFAVSFTESPRAFDFTGMTLQERLDLVNKNVGYTTNFESAIDLVIQAIKTSGQHKDMIVFTDGQFDSMHRPQNTYGSSTYYGGSPYNRQRQNTDWTTCHQRILQKCATIGLDKIPTIIYWNLRCDAPGVQTSAKHPGTQMLQGYSPAILKFALYGEEPGDESQMEEEITVVADDGTLKKMKVSKKTPYDTYRQALDQPCFDVIRQIVYDSQELVLSYITKQ
jgi:hypothetical protein